MNANNQDAAPRISPAIRVAIVTSIHPDFDSRIWKHATSLAAAGLTVHLICPWQVPTGTSRNGVVLHTFPRIARRLARPLLVPLRVGALLAPLLGKVDLVHFHDLDLLPFMAVLAARTPCVYDVHENYAEEMLVKAWLPTPLRRPCRALVQTLHRILPRAIGHIVFVVPEQSREFPPDRFHTLQVCNYASLSLVENARDNYEDRPDTVIFTGAHYKENGSLLLLDVAQLLEQRGSPLRFRVTDRFVSTAFRRHFEEEISRRRLTRVEIIPSVPSDRIMSLLNEATIGISPNLRVRKQELAIPTKLFEYLAAGLPVVASDLPFARNLLSNTPAPIGLLAPPEQPAAFADALQTLSLDRARARQMGRAGQSLFRERYTWESQMPGLLRFYETMLHRPGGSPPLTPAEAPTP
ncbi:MAG: glycosyltransferase [Lentisphaerae bacterium]|nr:glycosyltransferase [Lentisphaerota bacterium]